MSERTDRDGEPRGPIEGLCAQIRARAGTLSTAQLDALMHGINYGDCWCGSHIMTLPPDIDGRRDLSSIWNGLTQEFEQRTGHTWSCWSARSGTPPWERRWPKDSYMASWYALNGGGIAGSPEALRIAADIARGSGPLAEGAAAALLEAAAKREALRVPLLGWFANLCNARVREEVVDLAQADIRRRARQLLDEGRSLQAVRQFVWWQSTLCIVAVLVDTYHRVMRGPQK